MEQTLPQWPDPVAHLSALCPDLPVLYFCAARLKATARGFLDGFPGLVTYAVKANDRAEVLDTLVAAGVRAFDVASPPEIRAVRQAGERAGRDVVMHYNNPVRSVDEIDTARALGVRSWSVDCARELEKLATRLEPGHEVSVRFKLPVKGAAYDFGAKFGAEPKHAVALLAQAAQLGFAPALTFHPGTQCHDPNAWRAYIRAASDIARSARVGIGRLNVGGGFAAHRGVPADLDAIFAAIGSETAARFTTPPALICEPGRAMVAEGFALAVRVKSIRDDGAVFLNDGLYGHLAEVPLLGMIDRLRVLGPRGRRRGAAVSRLCFGPTCDSVDMLPDPIALPDDMEEGDHLLIDGLGAYGDVTATRFNGYGRALDVCVARI